MGKYYLRYLIFCLPAVIVSYLLKPETGIALQGVQWFCTFFMLLGWMANTFMASYHLPRKTLSFVLFYTGISVLVIVLYYSVGRPSFLYTLLRYVGGILSIRPFGIIVWALQPFNIPGEMYIICGFFVLLLLAWSLGAIRRRLYANPYRPRIQSR